MAATQAAVHGESSSKRRVRTSRIQNAFGLDEDDYDGESAAHQSARYESDPAGGSREYRLPDKWEDEELDSDEEGIFNSDDEDKYGDVFAKAKKSAAAAGKPGKKPATSSAAAAGKGKKGKASTASTEDDEYEMDGDMLDGADDDEEEEDMTGFEGAETINLSDMLDGPSAGAAAEEEEDEEEDARPVKKQKGGKSAAAAAVPTRKLTRKQLAALEAAEAEDAEEDDDAHEDAEEDEEDGEEEDDDDDDDAQMSLDDEDEDGEDGPGLSDAHKSLLKFVQGLESEDAKATASGAKGKDARSKRRGLDEQNEAFDESMFGGAAAATPASSEGGGLKLADLLKKMPSSGATGGASSTAPSLAALKKQLAVLSQSSHTRTLAEPLPELRAEELTRAAQYGAVKEEVARWVPLVNRNRDAATLVFPLNAIPRQNLSSAELQTRFHPSAGTDANALEQDLAALMGQYGLHEKELARAEQAELTLAKGSALTDAEKQAKESNIAKMKALLFYQEQKAARMARIKSKTYRRLKKKQREKGKLSLEEMKELEPLAYEAEQRKLESRRIEERMSLSHSNSSKWMAKALQLNRQQRNANADVRDALGANARLAQELRQKQEAFPKAMNSDGEESSEDSEAAREAEEAEEDNSDDDSDTREEKAAARASSRAASLRAKLAELEQSLLEGTGEEGGAAGEDSAPGFEQDPASRSKKALKASSKTEGLLGLKFMQKAAASRAEETRQAIRAYEAELAQEERREELRRSRRREGLEPLDDEELDVHIASSMPEGEAAASKAAAAPTGRRKVDALAAARAGALVSAAPSASVKLLSNSMQSAATVQSKGSKTRVDGPIAVALPAGVGKASASAAAAVAAAEAQSAHLNPAQHRTIKGKSSLSVDTPFIATAHHGKKGTADEGMFEVAEFSSDDEAATASRAKPEHTKLDLTKIRHDTRASLQAARKANAASNGESKEVRVGGMDDDAAANAAVVAEDPDANPWAQGNSANPRKAARQAAKAAKKAGKATAAAVSFAAGDEDEDDEDAAAAGVGSAAIDMDLSSGAAHLKSKHVEFDLLSGGGAAGGLSQAELVKLAFSAQGLDGDGDGEEGGVESAEAEFERLKAAAMDADLPKEETPVTGLPGWGSWGGLGAVNYKSAATLKREAIEKARREARRAQLNSSRADAKLRHVILNEKVDAKSLKYRVPTLPFPFTSVAQYEASLVQPVGREWNTTNAFQQNVRPAVITRVGEIIEPAKFNPKVGAGGKTKDKERKKAAGGQQPTSISGGAAAGQKRKR
jgi:U3 small nucleolar RNA-associated protein 14